MTPAITLLQKKGVKHHVLKYEHDTNASSYGLEAVEKLELNASTVFKTLVVSTDKGTLAVAIVPVNNKLSEKKMAKALGTKKVVMAKSEDVMTSTGYVLGGVSPLGQKKRLTTVIHDSAEALSDIYVSAGKRGLELSLSPTTLAMLTQATFADITA
ncbi:Cys-tRNA(Pro) deacylase [Alteromonas sp. 009811495]|uniref:Cys-tRNA(Pro) deacylase n=1 Tax=Alteromonas sp. 009811495 TaxID=3002962 RepID=UPI00237D60A5|nr:Cys-tRNA(Pro) deacylase [Alteromonas sp. 009811495]WDT87705.1 Cys-tRNA(Pro) deacylase [Alteromonas sp. 009811495]